MTSTHFWTVLALGIYGLIGAGRFAWAMHRKAQHPMNQQSQDDIRSFSPPVFFVVLLFEIFLWPVELAISAYVLLSKKW